MTRLAMFPLGSVLFPHMPMALRIFEERYIVMLSRVLQDDPSEFGVVLIERGHEVGGGAEQRFPVGTVASIEQIEAREGFIGLVARGGSRIAVAEWLADDPHPQAEVDYLPALEWHEDLRDLLDRAESLVRRTLAVASEFVDSTWSSDTDVSEDPVERAWQLAGIAPLGPLDQVTLLRASSIRNLLEGIIELTTNAAEGFVAEWDEG